LIDFAREFWRNKGWSGTAIAIALSASVALLLTEFIILLIALLVFVIDHLSSGLSSKPELDILYDVSSIFLPIITVIALLIAWIQLRSTERTSKGETYINIFETLADDL
jgi:hypothetical protein